jgi:hypothetical protein
MRDYEELIEIWIRDFRDTFSEYEVGCDDGDKPDGVKIIFDGFGDLEDDGEYIEGGDEDMESFAVFIHKTSLTEEFPQHNFTPWGLMHRPKEEVCIYAWYDRTLDEVTVIPFEDGSTELDHDFIKQLIHDIGVRDGYTEIDS